MKQSESNILTTYQFGNTTVHIAGDCIRTDPVEIERIIDEHHQAGWAIIDELVAKGEEV